MRYLSVFFIFSVFSFGAALREVRIAPQVAYIYGSGARAAPAVRCAGQCQSTDRGPGDGASLTTGVELDDTRRR